WSGCHVSRFGVPPAAGMTYTSVFPSYCPLKAICVPSGEKTAFPSWPPVVSCRATPPSRGTLHKYPPYVNIIVVLLTVGCCASSGLSSAALPIPVHNNTSIATSVIRVLTVPPSHLVALCCCFFPTFWLPLPSLPIPLNSCPPRSRSRSARSQSGIAHRFSG